MSYKETIDILVDRIVYLEKKLDAANNAVAVVTPDDFGNQLQDYLKANSLSLMTDEEYKSLTRETGHNPRHIKFMAKLYEGKDCGVKPEIRLRLIARMLESKGVLDTVMSRWLNELAASLDTPEGE